MTRQQLLAMLLLMIGMVSCKSIMHREERDLSSSVPQMVAANRQLGGGLSALGTLVSPLLFLMGMGSFISMLPQMFQTVLSGVGSNLIQSFTGAGATAVAGGSSSRLRRSVDDQLLLEDTLLDEIERRLNLAVLKNERPNI